MVVALVTLVAWAVLPVVVARLARLRSEARRFVA